MNFVQFLRSCVCIFSSKDTCCMTVSGWMHSCMSRFGLYCIKCTHIFAIVVLSFFKVKWACVLIHQLTFQEGNASFEWLLTFYEIWGASEVGSWNSCWIISLGIGQFATTIVFLFYVICKNGVWKPDNFLQFELTKKRKVCARCFKWFTNGKYGGRQPRLLAFPNFLLFLPFKKLPGF